jgi:hypothetical protein
MVVFSQPALTNKGLCAGVTVVGWDEVESYEWQENKLVLHWRRNLFRRSSPGSSYVVNPADRDAIVRLLAQYLPDKQVQPSPSAQATA